MEPFNPQTGLEELKETTIGRDREEILEANIKRFLAWIEAHPPFLDTAPRESARFCFEFERALEDGALELEEA